MRRLAPGLLVVAMLVPIASAATVASWGSSTPGFRAWKLDGISGDLIVVQEAHDAGPGAIGVAFLATGDQARFLFAHVWDGDDVRNDAAVEFQTPEGAHRVQVLDRTRSGGTAMMTSILFASDLPAKGTLLAWSAGSMSSWSGSIQGASSLKVLSSSAGGGSFLVAGDELAAPAAVRVHAGGPGAYATVLGERTFRNDDRLVVALHSMGNDAFLATNGLAAQVGAAAGWNAPEEGQSTTVWGRSWYSTKAPGDVVVRVTGAGEGWTSGREFHLTGTAWTAP